MAKCARFPGQLRAMLLMPPISISYASVSEHHSCGGMLIRKDLHRLFDLGLLRVDPDALVIHIHEEIRDIPAYGDLHGERLAIEIPR